LSATYFFEYKIALVPIVNYSKVTELDKCQGQGSKMLANILSVFNHKRFLDIYKSLGSPAKSVSIWKSC